MRSKQPYPTFNRAEEFSLSVGTRTANEVKKRCQFRFLPELLRKPMMIVCGLIKGIYSENDRGSEWALDG